MSMVLNMLEETVGSEYAIIYMNMSNYAKILNMPESAEIYRMWVNMSQYVCLTL